MTKVNTTQMTDGDFVIVNWREIDGVFHQACCGCGLVHEWRITPVNDAQVMIQIFRDKELTKKERARKKAKK